MPRGELGRAQPAGPRQQSLCQQIAVDGSSIIALNWQNRPRTAPLEVEIGNHEQLVDLAQNKPLPWTFIPRPTVGARCVAGEDVPHGL